MIPRPYLAGHLCVLIGTLRHGQILAAGEP